MIIRIWLTFLYLKNLVDPVDLVNIFDFTLRHPAYPAVNYAFPGSCAALLLLHRPTFGWSFKFQGSRFQTDLYYL